MNYSILFTFSIHYFHFKNKMSNYNTEIKEIAIDNLQTHVAKLDGLLIDRAMGDHRPVSVGRKGAKSGRTTVVPVIVIAVSLPAHNSVNGSEGEN